MVVFQVGQRPSDSAAVGVHSPAVTSRCLKSLDALTPGVLIRQADDDAPAR